MIKQIDYTPIPAHMREGFKDYFEHHRQGGGFMMALLSNDLAHAVKVADGINLYLLRNYVDWLLEFAPEESWGSEKRVKEWISKKPA